MLLLAVLTGVSRVYVGVHYPGDILGGFILGSLKPTLAQRLDQAVEEGCLTKEQAAATKADMDTKLKKVINTPLVVHSSLANSIRDYGSRYAS